MVTRGVVARGNDGDQGMFLRLTSVVMLIPNLLLLIPKQMFEMMKSMTPIQLMTFFSLKGEDRMQIEDKKSSKGCKKMTEFLDLFPGDEGVRASCPKSGRRLVLLYSFLMAKQKYLKKYAELFTQHGIDVLKIQISPLDALRPCKRAQVAAREVCEFLAANEQYEKIFVYGFSVGGYLFCETIKIIEDNPDKYGSIMSKFIGHMWDSPVDYISAEEGLAQSLTNNTALQAVIRSYMEWFLKTYEDTVTVHYKTASKFMHRGPIPAPVLYLYADSDTLSDTANNELIVRKWEKAGMQVQGRVFKEGVHCNLINQYRKEYMELLNNFIQQIGLVDATDMARITAN